MPDVTKAYVYTVVVTDGTRYGEAKAAYLRSQSKGTVSGISLSQGISSATEYKWTISLDDTVKDATLAAYYLTVPEDRNVTDTPVFAVEIKAANQPVAISAIADSDDKSVSVPIPADTTRKTYLLVEAAKDGYETTNYVELCR